MCTNGHGDSHTNPAQRGRVGENIVFFYILMFWKHLLPYKSYIKALLLSYQILLYHDQTLKKIFWTQTYLT